MRSPAARTVRGSLGVRRWPTRGERFGAFATRARGRRRRHPRAGCVVRRATALGCRRALRLARRVRRASSRAVRARRAGDARRQAGAGRDSRVVLRRTRPKDNRTRAIAMLARFGLSVAAERDAGGPANQSSVHRVAGSPGVTESVSHGSRCGARSRRIMKGGLSRTGASLERSLDRSRERSIEAPVDSEIAATTGGAEGTPCAGPFARSVVAVAAVCRFHARIAPRVRARPSRRARH